MTTDRVEALLAPLIDSAYRTALCLTNGPAEAETLLENAVARAVHGFGPPVTDASLRCRMLRAMTEAFRRGRHRGAGAGARGGTAYGTGTPSEGDRAVMAIRALGPSSRVVASLYFCEGLSCGEIAELLRCSRPAVRRRVGAVRTAFRDLGAAGRDCSPRGVNPLGTYRSAPGAGPAVSGGSTSRVTT